MQVINYSARKRETILKKQFSALLASRGLSSLIQAVTLMLLVRWAGAESFGMIAVITGIAAVLYTLSDWGAAIHIPRSRARRADTMVVGGLTVSLIGNSVAAMILSVGVFLTVLWSGWNGWLILIPLALAAEQLTEAGLTVSVADRVKRVVFHSLIIRRIVMLVLFVFMYVISRDPLLAYAVASVVSSLTGVIHVGLDLRTRLRGTDRPKVGVKLWKQFFSYALENMSSSSRNLDTTIVAAMTSVQATGYYSAAFRLSKPLNQIGGAATAVLVPHAARSSVHAVKSAARKLVGVAALGTSAALIISVFSEEILTVVFGEEFTVAGLVFSWALLSIAPVCLAPSLGGLLQGQGEERFVAVNGVIFAVVTLCGIFLGTMYFGIEGAAAGLAISYALKSTVLAVRLSRLDASLTDPLKQNAGAN